MAQKEIDKEVKRITTRSIRVPDWEELKKEYDPKLHPVMNKAVYQDKPGKKGRPTKVTRTTRSLQKRAVGTMVGMMFGLPVKRKYNLQNPDNAMQKRAAKAIEKIYERNRIDSLNIERGKKLFASCEAATLWYAVEKKNEIYGEKSNLKLRCRTFSPMDDDDVIAVFDEYDDLTDLSFCYQTKTPEGKTTRYIDSYTADTHTKYAKLEGEEWEIIEQDEIREIGKIPAVYINREEPVWENSNNVEEIEWAFSRNGNYLRRNAKPIFEVKDDQKINFGKENDDDERVILKLSSKGDSGYKTWDQATENLKLHTQALERGFFSDIRLPNFSFEEMKSVAASGESKQYMFVDAHLKVLEEQGKWLELLDRESEVIKAFAKIMFPELKDHIKKISIESTITPFTINSEKEVINNAVNATGGRAVMSRRTAIEHLGWVDDIEREEEQIQDDEMNDISEPTF